MASGTDPGSKPDKRETPTSGTAATMLGMGPVKVPGATGPSASRPPASRPGPGGAAAGFAIEAGLLVGSYSVVEVTAARAMDFIVTAEHKRLGRKVTLRLLRPDLAPVREIADRFMRDARLASQLGHPNLAEIYDSLRLAGNRIFQVLEPLGRVTVERLVAEAGPLAPRRAVLLAAQLADVLEAAHARGLWYGSLRPDSLFVVDRPAGETLKLVDLELAAAVGAETDGERAGEAAVADDVVAVGALLGGLLAGEIGGMKIVLPSNLPPALQEVILHCLAPEAAQRFRTMADLRRALLDCYDDLVVPGDDGRASAARLESARISRELRTGIRSGSTEEMPAVRARRGTALAVVLIALATLVAFVGYTRGKRKAPGREAPPPSLPAAAPAVPSPPPAALVAPAPVASPASVAIPPSVAAPGPEAGEPRPEPPVAPPARTRPHREKKKPPSPPQPGGTDTLNPF